MKDILKNKKVLISIASVLVLAILIVGGVFIFKGNDKDTKEDKKGITSNYVAYIKINPLIKLEFAQTCRNTNENDSINVDCDNPIVTKYELVNDDAKTIYKDVNLIDITDQLWSVLDLINTTAKEHNINVESIDIYSDWDKLEQYIEDKTNTTYNWKYNINIKTKDELKDITNSLEKEETTKKYMVSFNSDGGSKIETQEVKENEKVKKPTTPTKNGYDFVEWQLNGKKYDFETGITSNITLTATWKKKTNQSNNNNNQKPNTGSNNQSNNNNQNTNNNQNNNQNNNKPSEEPTKPNEPPKEEITYFDIPEDIINDGTYQQFAKEHGITINLVADNKYQCNSHFSAPANPKGYKKGDVVIAYGYYEKVCVENCFCSNAEECSKPQKFETKFRFGFCGEG